MASGSRGSGQGGSAGAGTGAGGDAHLETLTNPDLAHLPGVDLVVRLHGADGSGSDFADVALLLTLRERRLAEAEDRARESDEVVAGLRDKVRALELRAANAEALARNTLGSSDPGGISGGERCAVAREDDRHQSQAGLEPPQIGAAELTGGEIRARDPTASETTVVPELPAAEIEDGEIAPGVGFGAGVEAKPAEAGDNMPRPNPLKRTGAGAALPAASSMADELAEERAAEGVVVDVAVRSSNEVAQAAGAGAELPIWQGVVDSRDVVSEAVAGKRKQEPAAASASEYNEQQSLKKKPKPAGALGVASEDDSDSDSQVEEVEEELCFTEAEGWEMLDRMKAQVAAWETVYDAADAAQGTLHAAAATPPPVVEEVQTVIEAEARERSDATVARLQEEIISCKRRLEEVKDRAKNTEERLSAEITECKEKAIKTEAILWEEILLARSSAVTELEVWKHSAAEAQAQMHAASMTVARLREEIEAWKHRASETEMLLQTQDKIIDRLQEEIILCERRLEEVKDRAKNTEERLCAEITGCKEKAIKTEAVLYEEILLARSSAVTELEVWKHIATEAQAQIHAASMTVARLRNEIQAWEHRASETEMRLETQDKIIDRLHDKVVEGECKLAKAESRIRMSDELAAELRHKIELSKKDSAFEMEAQIRRATKIEDHLRAKIHTLELKVANLEARRRSDISRSYRTVVIDEHNHSRVVSEIEANRVVPTGTGATTKEQRQKGVSFYDEFFKSEMEKLKRIGNEQNEESLKKQAAAAASKALYLRCWSLAPHLPTQLGSQSVEDDSGGEA